MVGWKPIFIFAKQKQKFRYAAYDVVISAEREKDQHEWQQSKTGVVSLIDIFTVPGETIVDPFSGSGTFLRAAHEMGRVAIGSEINETI